MQADGQFIYSVTVRTGSEPGDGTHSPISFMIIGSKGKGQKRVITLKGFQPSSSVTKLLTSSDIGVPVGFQVDLEENGKWRLVYVKIQNMSMF